MKRKVNEYYLNDEGKLINVNDFQNNSANNTKENLNIVCEEKKEIKNANNLDIENSIIKDDDNKAKDSKAEDSKEVKEEVNVPLNDKINTENKIIKQVKNVEQVQNVEFIQYEGIVKISEYNNDSKLLSNPFLYDYDASIDNNIHSINSIENFYIKKGKKYYNFGFLVRENKIGFFRRKRMLKKQMHLWNEEFEKKLDDVSVYGSSQFQTSKEKIGKKVSFVYSFIAILGMLSSILLLNGKIWVIGTPSNFWAKELTYCAFIASFFTLLMIHLINCANSSIKKIYMLNKNEYNKQKAEIDKEFQRKYKYTYNYYVKGLKRKFKKNVLLLDKTAIGEAKINKISSVISDNAKKIQNANRNDKRLEFPKFLLKFLSIVSLVYVFSYAIYEIAIYFIKK